MAGLPLARTPDPQLFRDVFNSSPIGIVVEDMEGQPLFVNPAFCSMLGFSVDELYKKHCVDFSPAEDAEKDWVLFQQLRAGSIDHYQLEKRYFRRDGSLIWVNLSISLLKTVPPSIVAMVEDITEKKAAEEARLEANRALEKETAESQTREELLKIFVRNVPAGVAMLDREMRYLQVSDRWCTDYLSGREQVVGRSHYEIFPDMPERWKEVHRRALAGETLRADEDHWVGQDGPRWARWEVRPWKTPESTVGGILIFAEDITQRKKMEHALVDMSRKLIESEERERARIGRELHDDIGQRLTMLTLELEQLLSDPSELEGGLRELQAQAAEISHDVQALSHEFHSSTLEHLGIVAGARSWCRECAKRQRLEVDFKAEVQSVIRFEVGLCLFRVLQEALHNAAKHSGAKRIEVELAEHPNEVHLTVRDSGQGFDIQAAMRGSGLGLTSMKERVRLVNGKIEILSKPMGGTTIHVCLPLEPAHTSKLAAG